jgi:hypothetical protein
VLSDQGADRELDTADYEPSLGSGLDFGGLYSVGGMISAGFLLFNEFNGSDLRLTPKMFAVAFALILATTWDTRAPSEPLRPLATL